jgi:hypothetical protein
MNTSIIPQATNKVNHGPHKITIYEKLSRLCTLIADQGSKVIFPYCDIAGEHFTATLCRRTAKCGDVWASIVFVSNTDPSRGRRMVISPDAGKWLLLDDTETTVCNNNKYARYANTMLNQKAGN